MVHSHLPTLTWRQMIRLIQVTPMTNDPLLGEDEPFGFSVSYFVCYNV